LLLILKNSKPNILVGLPYGYMTLDNMEKEQVTFWRSQIFLCCPRLFKYFDRSTTYYNANVTRLYFGYKDKSTSSDNFKKMMSIWYHRRVLLIEGEKSRMGVGNDLFEQVESLERILCPYHHAFSRYEEILAEALMHDKGKLILVSLGPAAKALAFELANQNYQALDIGNLDIEYEWFRKGVKERIIIPGKYTSEVAGGRQVQDSSYLDQVVARFT
ncbi:MAG: GT-D fold domain-containing glycosyltransferase, partial [Cyclobacteriaceae bacterium]|nr:GT-D fold domain-containing glycosyltransferase [Cyclobacteriaceae bacterium]